jgi:hypothetical protein
MVRWDAPLFTVPWSDETVPGEDIWNAVTSGDIKPANQAVAAVSHPLIELVFPSTWLYMRADIQAPLRCSPDT